MSDTSKTPESKTYKPILYVHPFYPTFSIKEVPEGEEPKYQVKFNQAYVYDHQNGIIHPPIEISGMNSTFQIGDEEAKTFYVSLSLDEGRAVDAALMTTVGDVPASSEDAKYFLVCEIEPDLTIKSFKLRENIHWGFSKPSVLTDLNTATYTNRIAKHNNGIKDAEDVDINETITSIARSSDGFVYTNEEGKENEIEIPQGTKSVVTPESLSPMDGHKIATHNDGAGVNEDIEETVTTITTYGGVNGFVYTDEAGEAHDIDFPDAEDILPSGSTGDIIYYNGVAWVTLAAPTPAELAAFYGDPVLHHNGTAPYWGQDDYYL